MNNRLIGISVVTWLIVMLACLQATAEQHKGSDPEALLYLSEQQVYPLNNHVRWFQTSERIGPEQAIQQFSLGREQLLAPRASITATLDNDAYWLLFHLHNSDSAEKTVFLQLNNPHIDSVVLYQHTDVGLQHLVTTGATLAFSSRPYPYHDFVLPLKLSAGETKAYLLWAKKEGKVFSMQPELMSTSYFHAKEQRLYTTFGIFIGIMLFNILVNVFLGISLRDRIHYLYAVYVLASLTWLFCSIGAEFQYVFPDHPQWFSFSQSITGAVTMILMGRLAFHFLQLKQQRSRATVFLQIMTVLLLLVLPVKILAEIFMPREELFKGGMLYLYLLGIAGVALAIIVVAIVRIRQGFRPAWFYLLAMCYLSLSILISCYNILQHGDLSMLFSAPTHIQMGLLVETLIIFLGIIYRYNLLKKERKALQKKLAQQQLDINQQIINAQEDERRRLAQDLHDDVGATLSTLILHISNVPDGTTPSTSSYNERGIAIAKKAMADLRNISHDLLPKDFKNSGLSRTVLSRVEELNSSLPLSFHVNIEGDDARLQDIQAIILYRIINELLNNALKHSEATALSIDIAFADDITLVIEDNGQGFQLTESRPGIGLQNLYARVAFLGGRMDIDSNKQGTTVIVVLPWDNLKTN